MKAPTYAELLGVQCRFDADLILKHYPEWCSLPLEERTTSDGVTFQQREYKATHFNGLEMAGLLAVGIGLIFVMVAFIMV